jgi:hypothetical protein
MIANPYSAPQSQPGNRAAKDSPYQVACSCGAEIGVTAGQAGETAVCRCGKWVAIPNLSDLRRSAGEAAYGEDVVGAVRHALAAGGALPAGRCVSCGTATESRLDVVAECETPFAHKPSGLRHVLALFWIQMWAVLEIAGRNRKGDAPEVYGREVVVQLRLSLCGDCRSHQPGLLKPRRVKHLLRLVPLYRGLLDKYPRARLTIGSFVEPRHG